LILDVLAFYSKWFITRKNHDSKKV